MSLLPNPKLGFRRAGEVTNALLSFADGSDRYDIKSTGRMPRELAVWTAESGEPLAGAELWLSDGTRAGVITSVARHPLEERLQGLAYLRQGLVAPDSQLLVGDAMTSISASLRIQHLPCR